MSSGLSMTRWPRLQLEDVPEALGGDYRDPGSLVLDDSVGSDSGAVGEERDVFKGDAGFFYGLDYPDGLVARGGRGLRHPEEPVFVDRDQVRERTANVDPDLVSHLRSPMSPPCAPCPVARPLLAGPVPE